MSSRLNPAALGNVPLEHGAGRALRPGDAGRGAVRFTEHTVQVRAFQIRGIACYGIGMERAGKKARPLLTQKRQMSACWIGAPHRLACKMIVPCAGKIQVLMLSVALALEFSQCSTIRKQRRRLTVAATEHTIANSHKVDITARSNALLWWIGKDLGSCRTIQ